MGDCTAKLPQEVSVKASQQVEDLELSIDLGDLVTKYRAKIFTVVCYILSNENDAWDLAQEGFLKA